MLFPFIPQSIHFQVFLNVADFSFFAFLVCKLPVPIFSVGDRGQTSMCFPVKTVDAIMQMRRELTGGSRRAVSGRAHRSDQVSGADDIPFFQPFAKMVQMGEIVIIVMDVANSDPPTAIAVPTDQFHIAVAGA